MAEGERKLISIKELAALVGVSVPTINRRKRDGLLPHHKIGSRVVLTPEDVTAFLDSCKVSAKKEAH
jgi:excisionase family DNA binding protein